MEDLVFLAQNNRVYEIKEKLKFVHPDDERNAFDYTPLMSACFNGHLTAIDLLLSASADINRKTKQGFTAVMYATYNNKPEVVKLLLEKGANTSILTNTKRSALTIAQENHIQNHRFRDMNHIISLLNGNKLSYKEVLLQSLN